MKAYLTRRYKFSASHRLHSDSLTAEENRLTYGKCNNPYGHGHNYVLEVTVGGTPDVDTGMVCDLADLDSFVDSEILERYNESNLNCIEAFQDVVPTTENLSIMLYRVLQEGFLKAKVEKVRI